MGFQFSLATVLRLREIAEQREERLLTQILVQINSTRQSLDELKTQVNALLRRREQELQERTPAAQLHVNYAQMRALEAMQKDVTDQLAQLETLRLQQVKIYDAARCARELVAAVREQQFERFIYERARQEQMMMDDMFISRRGVN
jgi:flagellar export protein FliJ